MKPYMIPEDATDILFTKLQTRLNSVEVAPCENLGKHVRGNPAAGRSGKNDTPDTCLSHHDWEFHRGLVRFYYAPEAAAHVNKHFCAPCKASWYVAVARNLMFGIVS